MEKQEFKTVINAPREKVWEVLWADETYPEWTAAFSEGSRAISDWNKGSKILFVNQRGEGMVSSIADKVPNEFMSFRHLGFVKDGVEVTGEAAGEWHDAYENYTLRPVDGRTELVIDMDIASDYKDYFLEKWPKALKRVKELAESKS